MNFKDKIYKQIILINKDFTENEIFKALKFYSNFERKECKKILKELINEGLIFYDKKNKKYKCIKKENCVIKGKVCGNKRGFAFVIPENNEMPDIFVPHRRLCGALHNDIVLCRLTDTESGSSDEGEIISVLERANDIIVGIYYPSNGYGFVEPCDQKFYTDIYIPDNNTKAVKGDKVVVKITSYPKRRKNPEGKIIEILGAENSNTQMLSIIRSYKLYDDFDKNTIVNAEKIATTIGKDEKAKREDFTKALTITIDGEDAKDLDDAISISKKGDIYELCVHIADVSHYVKQNNAIDKEALKRGTSVYFPDRVLPMLPVQLSNGICSLNPDVERLTLSVVMEVDNNGHVLKSRICESVIKSAARMTYNSVQKIIEEDKKEIKKYNNLFDMILLMKELALILISKRGLRGSIDFDMPESKITVDENGEVKEIKPYPRKLSNQIIEEFMILANETVAKTCFDKNLPFVYRTHEKPSQEKMKAFKLFINGLGYDINEKDTEPLEFANLLYEIEGKLEFSIINKVMLRTMMKAKYSPANIGHFGLASKFYCHFTSPIRRYPDLMIHRIIKEYYLNNKKFDKESMQNKVAEVSLISSEREKLAIEAEREAEDYFKAKYMEKHIGMEYSGIISGVTEFGIFVELDNTVEGLVKIENLPDDNYQYIKEKYILKGKNNVFKLGANINIKVESADSQTKRIDFILA